MPLDFNTVIIPSTDDLTYFTGTTRSVSVYEQLTGMELNAQLQITYEETALHCM